MPKDESPLYLSVSKAARRIGVSASTLRAAEVDGSGPPYTLTPGGHRRYLVSDLENWLHEDVEIVEEQS